MLTLFLWDCWITFESLIWEQSFTFLQFKPYYNVRFNFFGSISFIFFFCDLKKFLTLSFYWNTDLLSSMSSMTLGYFCNKICWIKLTVWDGLIFILFISYFVLNFVHWCIWVWIGYILNILVSFFFNFIKIFLGIAFFLKVFLFVIFHNCFSLASEFFNIYIL